MKITDINNGAVLAIGDCNHDFVLEQYRDKNTGKISSSCRSVPKEGDRYAGCRESGFGSLRYFSNYVRHNPSQVQLTPEGALICKASNDELTEIGGVW